MPYRRYIRALVLFIICSLGMIGLGNWLIDPFNLFSSSRLVGISEFKPFAYHYEQQSKSYMLDRLKPEALILGNSRPDYGLNPDHPAWAGLASYNSAYGGGSLAGAAYYLQRALSLGNLKQVVLAVDDDMFAKAKRPLDPSVMNVDDFFKNEVSDNTASKGKQQAAWWAPLFSFDTVTVSTKTLVCRNERHKFELKQTGHTYVHQELFENSAKDRFAEIEKKWARKLFHPDDNGVASYGVSKRKLKSYRDLLRLAYDNNIDLRIFINPSHARKYELYRAAGLEPELLAWKRNLVEVNEEEAQRAGRPAFPLWDFFVINSYTTERVSQKTTMQWWIEASHYTPGLGEKVMDRIFDKGSESGFGSRVDSSNIEEHFRHAHSANLAYLRDFPEEAKDIEEVIKNAVTWAKSGYTESKTELVRDAGYCDSN